MIYSRSAEYAIRAFVHLAQVQEGKYAMVKNIAEQEEIPAHFLAKILQQLAKKKILSSSKGPHGGFSLFKDPKKITLLDIVNTIDGQDIFTNCLMHNGSCEGLEKDKVRCPMHEDYEKSRRELVKLFNSRTIYELVMKSNKEDLINI
jgi:Rrf2 family iron-sulfur cluster assembly transcriptional regulator